MRTYFVAALCALGCGWTAAAQPISAGSDGSDGAFTFVPDTVGGTVMTIDLSRAATQAYTLPSPAAGRGVYDPALRAVVFKWTNATVPAGRTVRFRNHGSTAPVVWLAQTQIVIDGTLDASGDMGHAGTQIAMNAEPGPGGFAGGRGNTGQSLGASAGLGPGGAQLGPNNSYGSGGSYGTLGVTGAAGGGAPGPLYGTAELQQLLGGSGGSGGNCTFCGNGAGGGGGGGGAILLAANTLVRVTGSVLANGGAGGFAERHGGGGAGGAIRLVAGTVELPGGAVLSAQGGAGTGGSAGSGGLGRIRVEANTLPGSIPASPPASSGPPASIFPTASSPSIRFVSLDGVALPANPAGGFVYPFVDVADQFAGDVPLVFELRNIPITATVEVRVTARTGGAAVFPATRISGTQTLSTWSATVQIPTGIDAIQVRAVLP